MRTGEHEPVAARLEHESRRAAERIARGLSERVEGLAEGERRAEHLGNSVEAPLHLGLALALAEALGIVKREGREAGEGVEELEVLLVEAAVLPRADAEHAADLAQPGDRRVHDLGEHPVILRRRRRLGACEITLEDRATGGEHLLEGALGDDLAADVPFRHAQHGLAAKHHPALVEDPAVGGVGAEQLDDLGDEALDDRGEAEVRGEHLAGLEQRGLLLQAALVLLQQLGGVDSEPDLARDRLCDRDVVRAPGRRLGAVEGEDADHPVEDEDRRRDHGARPELDQRLPPTEARVVELRRGEDVGDRHRPPLARGEVGDGQAAGGVADGLDPGRVPFGADGRLFDLVAEPDERAREVERHPDLLDGDTEHRVEVELGAHAPRDLPDEALPREGFLERVARRGVTQGERGLVGEVLHELGLGRREEAGLLARDREDGGHAAVGEEGDEGCAVRAHARCELLVHLRRGLDVEDDERVALAGDRHDRTPSRLEVEHDGLPPGLVDPARDVAGRHARVLVHGRDHHPGHLEDALELVEEPVCSLAPAPRLRERGREPRDGLGLASALRRLHLRLDDTRRSRDQEMPLVPAPDEDRGRQVGKQGEAEDSPLVDGREEVLVRQLLGRDHRGGPADEHEDEPDAEAKPGEPPASPQKLGRKRERDAEVQRREDEKRNDLEQDDSTVVTHWAP